MNSSARNQLDISDKKFNLIYEEELLPSLTKLELQRTKKVGMWKGLGLVTPASIMIGIGVAILSNSIVIGLLVCVGLLSGYIFWQENHRISYEQTYKEKVLPLLFEHVDANLSYTAFPTFSNSVLEDNGLTRAPVNYLVASDGLSGTLGDGRVLVAKMQATYRSGRVTSNVFDGLFCQASFDQAVDGWVWIHPADRMVGTDTVFGNMLAAFDIERFESPTRVQFADPAFESYFRVYSSSPEFAQSVVSPKLMDELMDLHRSLGRVAFSLRNNTISAAIWTQEDYLMPDATVPATDREMALRTFVELKEMLSIVEALSIGRPQPQEVNPFVAAAVAR